MKNYLFILFLLPLLANAQVKPLEIEGTTPDLYLIHTTGPKESFYSIGRIYNISPKIMAPYNQLVLEKGLMIGQVVKIPLNEINFTQDGSVAADEVLIPVYHKVKPKETLYNISTTNNKVPVATLKKWNKLTTDAVPNGSNMIVGYLKVKKELSPLAANAVKAESPVRVQQEKVSPEVVQENKIDEPVAKKPEPKKIIEAEKPVIKEEPKKAESAVNSIAAKQEPAQSGRNFNGGIFKNRFQNKQDKEESGAAGIFKSTSGWEDGKYYCLHNSAQPGTIIKVTNPVNQRFVYAKVLDVIPDIKQNEGMLIRISNAAADELGVMTENFQCTLNF